MTWDSHIRYVGDCFFFPKRVPNTLGTLPKWDCWDLGHAWDIVIWDDFGTGLGIIPMELLTYV